MTELYFTDPSRPVDSRGLPMLLWNGKPVCPLPHVELFMYQPKEVHITLFVRVADSMGRQYYDKCHQVELDEWLDRWWNNPEGVLIGLGWSYNEKRATPNTTLADLGLI